MDSRSPFSESPWRFLWRSGGSRGRPPPCIGVRRRIGSRSHRGPVWGHFCRIFCRPIWRYPGPGFRADRSHDCRDGRDNLEICRRTGIGLYRCHFGRDISNIIRFVWLRSLHHACPLSGDIRVYERHRVYYFNLANRPISGVGSQTKSGRQPHGHSRISPFSFLSGSDCWSRDARYRLLDAGFFG